VLVPVPLVRGVAVTVVHIVDMVAVLNGLVSTIGSVFVVVGVVHAVRAALALVPVPVVLDMGMAVVEVVDVVAVLDRGVSAVRSVRVRMIVVDRV
jgi:hypothetical protein